jgi:hypothetical protein
MPRCYARSAEPVLENERAIPGVEFELDNLPENYFDTANVCTAWL